jgi:hypothetical protein
MKNCKGNEEVEIYITTCVEVYNNGPVYDKYEDLDGEFHTEEIILIIHTSTKIFTSEQELVEEFTLIKEEESLDQEFIHLTQDTIFHVFEDLIAIFLENSKGVLSWVLFFHCKYKSQFHDESQLSIQYCFL